MLIDFENPEKCQEACQADPACAGFTLVLFSNWCWNLLVYILSPHSWTNENSDVVSLACVLFSNLGEETSCQNCISGRQSCLIRWCVHLTTTMVCLHNWNLDATQLKGPPECRCVVPGECEVTGENVLDVVSFVFPLSPGWNLCNFSGNWRCKWKRMCESLREHRSMHCLHIHGWT